MTQTSAQQAKKAAKEDALPTGPANIPGTQPATKGRNKLSDAERAKKAEEQFETRLASVEYRTTLICNQLSDMGVSSLVGQTTRYTDLPNTVFEDAVNVIQKRLDAVKAAIAARQAAKKSDAPVGISLRASLAKTLP